METVSHRPLLHTRKPLDDDLRRDICSLPLAYGSDSRALANTQTCDRPVSQL